MSDRQNNIAALLFLAPAILVLAGGVLIPLAMVALQSVVDSSGSFTLDGYSGLFSGTLFRHVLMTTFEITATATLVTLAISYPVALHLARQTPTWRAILFGLVLLPFWTSILVKSFAFIILLGDNGIVASALRWIGVEQVPKMMFNRFAVVVGLVHFFIPFMVFPILANLLQRDTNLERAAEIMGAGPVRIFFRIVLPLSMPAVVGACLLTFILCLGFFITPALLGTARDTMIANIINLYTREILNWTRASAASVVLLVLSLILMAILARFSNVMQSSPASSK